MNRHPSRVFTATLVAILAAQQTATAHAVLDHAEPRVGSTVAQSPPVVQITFTQAIEPAFSKIEVFDSHGKEVDKKDSHIDPKDHHVLIVSMPEAPPGTYKVRWHVVSVDTHRAQGDFKFFVKPKG